MRAHRCTTRGIAAWQGCLRLQERRRLQNRWREIFILLREIWNKLQLTTVYSFKSLKTSKGDALHIVSCALACCRVSFPVSEPPTTLQVCAALKWLMTGQPPTALQISNSSTGKLLISSHVHFNFCSRTTCSVYAFCRHLNTELWWITRHWHSRNIHIYFLICVTLLFAFFFFLLLDCLSGRVLLLSNIKASRRAALI